MLMVFKDLVHLKQLSEWPQVINLHMMFGVSVITHVFPLGHNLHANVSD